MKRKQQLILVKTFFNVGKYMMLASFKWTNRGVSDCRRREDETFWLTRGKICLLVSNLLFQIPS